MAASDGASGGGRQVGCLDVHTERVSDPEVRRGNVTIAFAFGNRCVRPLEVTLNRVRVIQRDEHGRERTLHRYDPTSVVESRTLDGRSQGFELIEYDAPGDTGSSAKVTCVDLTRVLAGAPEEKALPVCFTESDGPVDHEAVLGHQPSPSFGSGWHARAFYFFGELSASERTIGLGDTTFSGRGAGGSRFELTGLNRITTFGIVDHFNLRVAGPLYIGGAIVVGGAHLGPRAPFLAGPGLATTGSTAEELGAGALVGLMSRSFGSLRFRGDITVGASTILVDVDVPGCHNACSSINAGRTWLQPRLVMDTWFNPWWTVSAWGAADVLHPPDVAIGLALGFHGRSFDGFP